MMRRTTRSWLLGLALLLLVSSAWALSDDESHQYVTCGSVVKLTHVESSSSSSSSRATTTGYYLQSENKNLGSGSGQQIVTCTNDPASTQSLWWIREAHPMSDSDLPCSPGTPIACNTILRLTHLETMKNLHTHGIPSPLSRQQEVTAFGQGDGKGDGGDNWMVLCSSSGDTHWKREARVRFLHQDTNKYLAASSTVKFDVNNCGHQCPILNQLEVFGRKGQDDYSYWKVDMGIHLFH